MNQDDKYIDNALIETLRNHPDYSQLLVSILFDNSINRVNRNNFMCDNNARDSISGLETKNFIKYILKKSVMLYEYVLDAQKNSAYFNSFPKNVREEAIKKLFPELDDIRKYLTLLGDSTINSIVYFQMNPNELLIFIQFIVNGYFEIDNFYDEKTGGYTSQNIDNLIEHSNLLEQNYYLNDDSSRLCNKIESDYFKLRNINHLEFNQNSVNRCLEEIRSGKQIKSSHSDYNVGNDLYATQDIGNKRTNQEDSVLIMNHPKNSDFKLLVVSDGMGGKESGEIASWTVVNEMSKWFQCIPEELYLYPAKLLDLFNLQIEKVSQFVYQKLHGAGGATFVGAVVAKDYSIVSNVGDSRAMIVDGGKLSLVTEDDSYVFRNEQAKLGRNLSNDEIDQLRFNRRSNQILRYMGMSQLSSVQSFVIDNNHYDKLLLLSDGVADLLTLDEIKVISRTTDPESITNMLVQTALSRNAINYNRNSEDEYDYISAGKDNATAAMYSRR